MTTGATVLAILTGEQVVFVCEAKIGQRKQMLQTRNIFGRQNDVLKLLSGVGFVVQKKEN